MPEILELYLGKEASVVVGYTGFEALDLLRHIL